MFNVVLFPFIYHQQNIVFYLLDSISKYSETQTKQLTFSIHTKKFQRFEKIKIYLNNTEITTSLTNWKLKIQFNSIITVPIGFQ